MSLPALPRGAKDYQVENTVNRLVREFNLTGGATLLQMVSFETGAVATGTTLIPADDTIPQSDEGDQYMSLAITPKSATSKLVIDVAWVGASNVLTNLVAALFKDAGSDALATSIVGCDTSGIMRALAIQHEMSSGSTGATTFKVRVGATQAGTVTFNGSGGSRLFGGTMASSIVIREYA